MDLDKLCKLSEFLYPYLQIVDNITSLIERQKSEMRWCK